jgi:hypothetical protein
MHDRGMHFVASRFGIWLGNITTLILLGAAPVWQWRARLWRAAATVAAAVAAKLFLWPLAVWFLVTRRFGRILLATLLAGAAAGIKAGWAVIGWGEAAKLSASCVRCRGYRRGARILVCRDSDVEWDSRIDRPDLHDGLRSWSHGAGMALA